jgi:hypothetical protein
MGRNLLYFSCISGYVRFLNDRREKVRSENPNLPFPEITKLLAVEWSQLPASQKQVTAYAMKLKLFEINFRVFVMYKGM